MLPLIDEVRPTASLGAPTKASCSRTRYPATEFFATVHDPAAWPLARGEADVLGVALRPSFAGAVRGKTTRKRRARAMPATRTRLPPAISSRWRFWKGFRGGIP